MNRFKLLSLAAVVSAAIVSRHDLTSLVAVTIRGTVPELGPDAGWQEAVRALRRGREVTSKTLGFGGRPSPAFAAFERMRDTAPRDELRRLTADRSPAVRAYAFRALAEIHPDEELLPLLLARLEDNAMVTTHFGCVVDSSTVLDLALRHTMRSLDDRTRDTLFAALLDNGSAAPEGRRLVLRHWRLGPQLRSSIRRRVVAGDTSALVALAQFRDTADIPLIQAGLTTARDDALAAVERFPDPTFLPQLLEVGRGLERANNDLSDYGPPGASRLLRALAAYDYPAATNVEFELWETHHMVSRKRIEHLWQQDPMRAARASAAALRRPNRYAARTLDVLVGKLGAADPDAAVGALNAAIAEASLFRLTTICRHAAKLGDGATLAILLRRLERREPSEDKPGSQEPHIYLPLLEAIASFPTTAADLDRVAAWTRASRGEVRPDWDDGRRLRAALAGLGLGP